MRINALVLAAALMAAAPAFAQTDPAPPSPVVTEGEPPAQAPTTEAAPAETTPATTASEAPRRICRTVQRTESRLRTRRERICGTQEEWDRISDESADTTRNVGRVAPGSN